MKLMQGCMPRMGVYSFHVDIPPGRVNDCICFHKAAATLSTPHDTPPPPEFHVERFVTCAWPLTFW